MPQASSGKELVHQKGAQLELSFMLPFALNVILYKLAFDSGRFTKKTISYNISLLNDFTKTV